MARFAPHHGTHSNGIMKNAERVGSNEINADIFFPFFCSPRYEQGLDDYDEAVARVDKLKEQQRGKQNFDRLQSVVSLLDTANDVWKKVQTESNRRNATSGKSKSSTREKKNGAHSSSNFNCLFNSNRFAFRNRFEFNSGGGCRAIHQRRPAQGILRFHYYRRLIQILGHFSSE